MFIHLGDAFSKRESHATELIDSSLPTANIINRILALKPNDNYIEIDCAAHFIREKQLVEMFNDITGCKAIIEPNNYINTIFIVFNK